MDFFIDLLRQLWDLAGYYLLGLIPIIFFMYKKYGWKGFNNDVAEYYGKKSMGASGPRVPTWIGVLIIVVPIAIWLTWSWLSR